MSEVTDESTAESRAEDAWIKMHTTTSIFLSIYMFIDEFVYYPTTFPTDCDFVITKRA